jgi:hypothetical protein
LILFITIENYVSCWRNLCITLKNLRWRESGQATGHLLAFNRGYWQEKCSGLPDTVPAQAAGSYIEAHLPLITWFNGAGADEP